MKINQTVLIILLAVGLAVQTYFLFIFSQKNKSLEKSIKFVDKELEVQKEKRAHEMDSIQELIHYQDEYISDLNAGLDNILDRLDKINIRSNEKKSTILTIRNDADLRSTIANRYYRR